MKSESISPPRLQIHPGEAGFSLVEMLVGLAVMAEVLLVVLLLFDLNNRVSRVQTSVSEMQQSQRVGQHDLLRFARMAGRGTLPRRAALQVQSNVTGPATTLGSGSDTEAVLANTDILTVRGVFTSPIYQVDSVDDASFNLNASGEGTVVVRALSPAGITQDLTPLVDAAGTKEPIILTSPVSDDIYAVVEVKGVTTSTVAGVDQVEITFYYDPSMGDYNSEYMELSQGGSITGNIPAFPANLESVAFVGLLEEYRYYIQDDNAISGDLTTEKTPKLARARFFPNTNVAYDVGGTDNLDVEIAENIVDMQIAMAVDLDDDDVIAVDASGDPTNSDEWFYNHTSDVPPPDTANAYFLRITTVAQSPDPDPQYMAPKLEWVEDHDWDEQDIPSTTAEAEARKRRRRVLTTTVDMRNVG